MKINGFSITFWFNIFDNHTEFLEIIREKLKDEYQNFNIKSIDDNLIAPIIRAVNIEKKTRLSMSQINLQYFMDNVTIDDLEKFKEKVLELFELLTSFNINVLHTSAFINSEIIVDDALEKITTKTLSDTLYSEDLVDANLKFGKKEEDLFYKIITVLNKKTVKMPRKVDELGRVVPLPLISWNGILIENEVIDISYEINDKYSFDFTKNYHTTEFYLNKMLYILVNNYENDINIFLEEGKF